PPGRRKELPVGKSKPTPPPVGPAFCYRPQSPLHDCPSLAGIWSSSVGFQYARVAEHETNVGAACLETLARISSRKRTSCCRQSFSAACQCQLVRTCQAK